MILRLFLIFVLLSGFAPLYADDSNALKNCPQGSDAVTVPAAVDEKKLLVAISALKTTDGKPALLLSSQLTQEIQTTFDPKIIKTKMEQFYRLLYVLAQYIPKPPSSSMVNLDAASTRAILLSAKVFSDDLVPNKISQINLNLKNKKMPIYEIHFSDSKTEVALNHGEGFYLFRNGKCQHAQKLIFRDIFSAQLRLNEKSNVVVNEFAGVDLFGDFGNRGVIDVDIQYVALKSVEFYKGTNLGKVTAYVSKEEFKKNDHNFLLKIITRIVPDRSVQPIDW